MIDEPDPRQREIYRNMTPAERLSVFMETYNQARKLKDLALRAQFPDADDDEIRLKVRDAFLFAKDW